MRADNLSDLNVPLALDHPMENFGLSRRQSKTMLQDRHLMQFLGGRTNAANRKFLEAICGIKFHVIKYSDINICILRPILCPVEKLGAEQHIKRQSSGSGQQTVNRAKTLNCTADRPERGKSLTVKAAQAGD